MYGSCHLRSKVLIQTFYVDGRALTGLVDTGCSVTLIKGSVVPEKRGRPSQLRLETMSGETVALKSAVELVSVRDINRFELGPAAAYIVESLPLGVDMVLGLDTIARVGLKVSEYEGQYLLEFGTDSKNLIALSPEVSDAVGAFHNPLSIADKDFSATFNGLHWVVKWVWKTASAPLVNDRQPWNIVSRSDQQLFDNEIKEWIDSGILIRHNYDVHGEVKCFLPLIGIRQSKGESTKVRPVLDYREFNETIESYPGGSTPICSERLRIWRQMGRNCSMLDLKKAYLQIHVDESLFVYQAILFKGNTYLLTRLGFGLAAAPKIMTRIVEKVLSLEDDIKSGVSSYIDDLIVNKDIVCVDRVETHLRKFGLEVKNPIALGCSSGTRVLGLQVTQNFQWTRDNAISALPKSSMTRREVHKVLGELVGHYPVAGWLRVSCAFIQRCTAQEKLGWDEPVSEDIMVRVQGMFERLSDCGDPVRGHWLVDTDSPITVWADASSIALGVALEISGDIVEDAAWLKPQNDSSHITRSELDAVIKGLNLALRWKRKDVTIKTDSSTVFGWLKSVIDSTHNVKTSALSEALIRRRLDILRDVVREEKLNVQIELVPSARNRADVLTRVPVKWLRKVHPDKSMACAAYVITDDDIKEVHDICHFGVQRTSEMLAEKFGNNVSKPHVKRIIEQCERCSRIDPSQKHRPARGFIQTSNVWDRLAMDITHVDGKPYLSVIDTSSRYTVWRRLYNESAREVCRNVNQVFSEFGPPATVLSDNGTVFHSRDFVSMMRRWSVEQLFSGAYRPQGNGMIERVHRSIKRTVKRSRCSVEEAVFWHNNTKNYKSICPYELLFSAISKKPGIATRRKLINRKRSRNYEVNDNDEFRKTENNPFAVGDRVFLRPHSGQCDVEWSGPHRVTGLTSNVSLVLNDDGVSRHVSHVRRVPISRDSEIDDDNRIIACPRAGNLQMNEIDRGSQVLRRSTREHRPPVRFDDYVMQ